ncbi:MAG: hypothetical protein DMG17_18500 [Acidobacteria bacterium]|nr:MAG: hypothetical protein DMG17_18500 [Acidobacteriota bacterium]
MDEVLTRSEASGTSNYMAGGLGNTMALVVAPDKHNTRMRRSGRPRPPEAGARTNGSTLAERMTVQDFIFTDDPNY